MDANPDRGLEQSPDTTQPGLPNEADVATGSTVLRHVCGILPVALTIGVLGAVALCLTPARGFASEQTVDESTRTALAMDVHPDRGAKTFARHCARCHGANASGNPAKGIPVLADQRFAYLVRQLASLAGDQRDSETMHGVLATPQLRQPQTWADVAAFLNRLPAPARIRTGNGGRVGLGEGIYRTNCASCHFEDARGDDDGFVPSLRNQHYPYLVGQLKRLAEFHRHNVDENIARLLGSLDADEAGAVADYLTRLRGPTKDRRTMRSNGVAVD